MDAGPPPVSPLLAGLLAAGRDHFNARVAEVRRRQPSFDAPAFAGFVRTAIDPLAQCVDALAPGRTGAVVVAAFDIALELVAQGLAGPGARSDALDRAWLALAPGLAPRIAADPFEVLGTLSNAIVHLGGVPGARVDAWIAGMAALASHADSNASLRALGQVLAWRAGLAHFRDGALACADALPAATALLAVGAAPAAQWPQVRDALRADPWWSPDPARREAVQRGIAFGSFSGFGGRFAAPPEVRADSLGLLVRSADRTFLLRADACGAVLLPADAAEFDQAASTLAGPPFRLDGTCLTVGPRRIDLDLPADGLAIAASTHTLAVSSPWTHAIRLVPRA